jgi:phosphoribosylformylglycinamidine (FGAM) synthase-like amidotransferase family enzyme
MAAPRALILTGYGINCDRETAYAFRACGAEAKRVHVNDLIDGHDRLSQYQILAFPGGFSFGDDIASGKVLANKVKTNLAEAVDGFVAGGGLVIGICNGFQVMVNYGLLGAASGAGRELAPTLT